MHPTLQHQLNDLHQHDLIVEADARRRAAQVPRAHRARHWTASLFLALGHALIARSAVETAITSAACARKVCRPRAVPVPLHAHAIPHHSFSTSSASCAHARTRASCPHP